MRPATFLLQLAALATVCQCTGIQLDVELHPSHTMSGANGQCLAKGDLHGPPDDCVSDPMSLELMQVGASALARRSSTASGAATLSAAAAEAGRSSTASGAAARSAAAAEAGRSSTASGAATLSAVAAEAATDRAGANASTAVVVNSSAAVNASLVELAVRSSSVSSDGASVEEAVALARLQKTVTTGGDFTQGLIFTMIAVIIVIGVYLLLCTEIRPGAVDSAGPYSQRFNEKPFVQTRPTYTTRPSLPQDSRLRLTPFQSQPAAASANMLPPMARPSTGAAGNQLAGLQGRRTSRWEDWHQELPKVYPTLVIPNSHTRLAVPLEALAFPSFEIDVLGMSGVPLLCASLMDAVGSRSIEISLHSVGKLLAIVNEPGLEIRNADGGLVGQLFRDEHLRAEGPQYTLRDAEGRPYLMISSSTLQDGRNFKVSSMLNGRIVERATAVRRLPGKLPAEHYEVVANPDVDAVLILACLLAAVVFESPASRPQDSALLASGRPSMNPFRSEAQSLPGAQF